MRHPILRECSSRQVYPIRIVSLECRYYGTFGAFEVKVMPRALAGCVCTIIFRLNLLAVLSATIPSAMVTSFRPAIGASELKLDPRSPGVPR